MIAQIATMGQIRTKRNLPSIHLKRPVKMLQPSVPYFERNNFVKEEVTTQELLSLHDLGFNKMTAQDLIETKTALNVIGYSPAIKLINLAIENDVLGFARPGIDNHPHLNFLTTLLPRLRKEAGTTHLALALPTSLQRLLDVFVVTGEILPNLSPVNLEDYGLKGENNFVELLKAARLAGYQFIAVEPNIPVRAFDPQREQLMFKAIEKILHSTTKAKIIFLAPDKHLGYLNVGDWMPVAGLLKEAGFAICTVNQYWQSDFMPLVFSCLLKELAQPMAIASKDVKMFAALQSRSLSLEHILPNNWDITIIYPKMGRSRLLKQRLIEISAVLANKLLFGRK